MRRSIKVETKEKGIKRRLLTRGMMLMMLCTCLWTANVYADEAPEPNGTEESDDGSGNDIEKEVLSIPEGSATIVEFIESTPTVNNLNALLESGETVEDLTFDNDVSSVTKTETYKKDDVEVHTNPLDDSDKHYEPKAGTDSEVKFVLTASGDEVELCDGDKAKFDTMEGEWSEKTEGEEVVYVNTKTTESENAINKAIRKALENATGNSKVITISIDDGQYDGDIEINTGLVDEHVTLKDGFTLYLLGKDSYVAPSAGGIIDKSTITSAAGNGVRVGGNINIEGIDVVLAGIYLTLDNTINVKNASLKYIGTSEDDEAHIVFEGSEVNQTTGKYKDHSLSVATGDGGDTVNLEIDGNIGNFDIATEDGDDNVSIKAVEGKSADSTKMTSGQAARTTRIDTGADNDQVTVELSVADILSEDRIIEIALGDDKDCDSLNLKGALLKDAGETKKNIVANDTRAGYEGNELITLYTASDRKLRITNNAENYKDELTDKSETKVTADDLNDDGTYKHQGVSFTDFVISADLVKEKKIVFADDRKLYFTKIVVKGDDIVVKNRARAVSPFCISSRAAIQKV